MLDVKIKDKINPTKSHIIESFSSNFVLILVPNKNEPILLYSYFIKLINNTRDVTDRIGNETK